MNKEPMSDLARAILGQGPNFATFTQREFDDALEAARAEIMAFAITSAKQAVMMEREACAVVAEGIKNIDLIPEAIRNRIPSQRQ